MPSYFTSSKKKKSCLLFFVIKRFFLFKANKQQQQQIKTTGQALASFSQFIALDECDLMKSILDGDAEDFCSEEVPNFLEKFKCRLLISKVIQKLY